MRYPNALRVILVSTWVLSLSGCGQKGDLYLPDIPPAPTLVSVDDNAEEREKEAKKKNTLPASVDD